MSVFLFPSPHRVIITHALGAHIFFARDNCTPVAQQRPVFHCLHLYDRWHYFNVKSHATTVAFASLPCECSFLFPQVYNLGNVLQYNFSIKVLRLTQWDDNYTFATDRLCRRHIVKATQCRRMYLLLQNEGEYR